VREVSIERPGLSEGVTARTLGPSHSPRELRGRAGGYEVVEEVGHMFCVLQPSHTTSSLSHLWQLPRDPTLNSRQLCGVPRRSITEATRPHRVGLAQLLRVAARVGRVPIIASAARSRLAA
jgi:hypothetical protein